MPTHTHVAQASDDATGGRTPTARRQRSRPAQSNVSRSYASARTSRRWRPDAITNVGGSQAHLNMQPFLTLNFCIALQGIFPSQT